MRKLIITSLISIILLITVSGYSVHSTNCYSCHSPSSPSAGYIYSPPTVILNTPMFVELEKNFRIEVEVEFSMYEIEELEINISQIPEILSFDGSTQLELQNIKESMSINFTAIPTKNGVCRLVLTVIAVVYYNHAGGDETDYREEVVEDSATIIVGIPSIVPSSWYVIMNDNGGVITLSVERDIYNLTIFAPEYIYVEPTSMDYVPAGSNLTIILRPVVEKKTDDAVVIAWRENETLYAIVIDTIYNPSMHAKVDYYSISGRVTGILAIVILLCSIVLGGIGKKLKLLLNRKIGAERRIRVHCGLSWFLFALAVYHGIVLLIAPYFLHAWNIRIVLGEISAVTMLIVSVNGSFMREIVKVIGREYWCKIHNNFSWLAFVFGVMHAVLIGTDFGFIREWLGI